jgi:hypothetical protein
VVLARGDRAEIEAYVAADPFAIEGVAVYDITEVAVTRTASGLEGLRD